MSAASAFPAMLPINEVFETLQGEAWHTGTPAIFVRLQGCDVGCPWCDTKHTWPVRKQDSIDPEAMMAKVDPAPTFAVVEPVAFVRQIANRFASHHVVITGGEPCDHDLRILTTAFIGRGHTVQIETSGTAAVVCDPRTWVTVSPKVGMPGGLVVNPSAVRRADEIKWPVGKPDDVAALIRFLEAYPGIKPRGGIWVQPLSRSPKATALCIEAARDYGWRVSIQVHAFIGVR